MTYDAEAGTFILDEEGMKAGTGWNGMMISRCRTLILDEEGMKGGTGWNGMMISRCRTLILDEEGMKGGKDSRIRFSFSCIPAFLIPSILIPYIFGAMLPIDSHQGRARPTRGFHA
jgi:hypothetical protein